MQIYRTGISEVSSSKRTRWRKNTSSTTRVQATEKSPSTKLAAKSWVKKKTQKFRTETSNSPPDKTEPGPWRELFTRFSICGSVFQTRFLVPPLMMEAPWWNSHFLRLWKALMEKHWLGSLLSYRVSLCGFYSTTTATVVFVSSNMELKG